MTYEMKLQEMQDFGYNKGKTDGKIEGKFEGKIESIKELMRNLNLSPEKAMKALGIAPSEFSRYLALNIIHCASYAGVYSFLVYFSVFLLSFFAVFRSA